MLDQKLIREEPTFVEENLSLRGKGFDISLIHQLTLEKKEIDIEISTLQSESKKISKLIGIVFSKSQSNNSQELNELKKKGVTFLVEPYDFMPGSIISYVSAPDGVSIEIVQAST